jgi:hypothetical protein
MGHPQTTTNKPIVVDARLGITCSSMVFLTIKSNIPFTKEDQDEKPTQGHWLRINLQSQMFSQLEKKLVTFVSTTNQIL